MSQVFLAMTFYIETHKYRAAVKRVWQDNLYKIIFKIIPFPGLVTQNVSQLGPLT